VVVCKFDFFICMGKIFTIILFLIHHLAFAQNILQVRKNKKTIESFFPGRYISGKLKDGTPVSGLVKNIYKDSIFIEHFDLQKQITSFGGIYFDTVGRYNFSIAATDIGLLNSNRRKNFNWQHSAYSLQGGAILLLIGAPIDGIYHDKNAFGPSARPFYIAAPIFFALGHVLRNKNLSSYRVGKKYQLKILLLKSR
jgi:hypothetical protein